MRLQRLFSDISPCPPYNAWLVSLAFCTIYICFMRKILFISSLATRLSEQVIQHQSPDDKVLVVSPEESPVEIQRLISEQEYLILFPSTLGDEEIEAGKNLQLVQLVSAGFDRVNLELCRSLGVPVANNGGTNAPDVAEHALMFMLSYLRRFVDFDRFVKAGQWRGIDSAQTTFALGGKTVGIIGLGKIGQRVAQLLAPFGAKIIFYDAFPPPLEVQEELRAVRVSLDQLLVEADIITIHVPLNDDTRQMINAESLGRMKSSALLINTCRGEVIDEQALATALKEGQIRAAALDVMVEEPPAADHPLLGLENVIFTPHTAGVTFDSFSRRGEFIFANIDRVARGEEPLALVN